VNVNNSAYTNRAASRVLEFAAQSLPQHQHAKRWSLLATRLPVRRYQPNPSIIAEFQNFAQRKLAPIKQVRRELHEYEWRLNAQSQPTGRCNVDLLAVVG
jgi:trehalose/maltose hydrolase-like predicted phosphorylase